MKNKTALFLALSIFTKNLCAHCAEPAFIEETNLMDSKEAQARASAMKAIECQPAEMDPNGNWGPVSLGAQVSLRTSTNAFTLGSPIPTVVIFRNTTTNSLSSLRMGEGDEVQFFAKDESGHIHRSIGKSESHVSMQNLEGMHQLRHEYDLAFELQLLTNGVYEVYAQERVFQTIDTTTYASNACSSKMTIEVLPK